MEQKKLKTPVFVNETVFSESAEQPVDVDFSLPDYCPDISKILKCRAVSRIASKGINGRSITIDGTVTVTVIYCDPDCRLCSYEYQYPFNKSFDTGMDADGAVLSVKTNCEYINCRAVTSRKLDIHGAAGIYVKLIKRKCTEIVSDVDDCNIELLRGCAPATSPMGCNEKYLVIEEEIEIGQGQPDIRSLIRYDSAVAVKECKLLASKVMITGEVVISLLYCPEQGGTQSVRNTIPFSQLVEIDGVTEQCECEPKVQIAYIDIKPRMTASGEAKSFMLNLKLLVGCECYCNNDIDVILDAYSRKYEADIVKNEVCFNRISRNINESFNCKKSLEFSGGALASIADMWCKAKTDSVKIADEHLTVNGTVTAFIIAFDTSGNPEFYEKTIEFEYKYPLSYCNERMQCEPKIEVTASNYTITGPENMELRVELQVSAAIYECTDMPLITDVSIDEKKQLYKTDRGAMTIYFASQGELLWDIARHYLASVDEIKKINDITEDSISENRMILVPAD